MIPDLDLKNILNRTTDIMKLLENKRIFLTGGTGFIGKWLIESFLYANSKLNLNSKIFVLSRDPEKFLYLYPKLANKSDLHWVKGDIESFSFPKEEFHYIIHGATSVADPVPPIETYNSIIFGTKRILDFAVKCNVKNFLLLSSGAVYGKQPSNLEKIPESFSGAQDPTKSNSAYGLGKLGSEWLSFEYGRVFNFKVCSARCYALVGPYLPLDKHFAMGNFILDAINDRPIKISGDGTPYRSYLYIGDLTAWLWTILLRGHAGEAYNVGSDIGITIRELATYISNITSSSHKIIIKQPKSFNDPERYVPSISKAKNELNLDVWTPLDQSIQKTVDWIKNQND